MDIGRFQLLYIDPPWSLPHGRKGDPGGCYPIMKTSEIVKLPVTSWAARDSYLVLWAPGTKLPDAFHVMRAWGFVFSFIIPWIKVRLDWSSIRGGGLGEWLMTTCEYLLIGRRGTSTRRERLRPCGLLMGISAERAVFLAPRGKKQHSAKPLGLYPWLERSFGTPRLEIFARQRRVDWLSLGHELGHHITKDDILAWPSDNTLAWRVDTLIKSGLEPERLLPSLTTITPSWIDRAVSDGTILLNLMKYESLASVPSRSPRNSTSPQSLRQLGPMTVESSPS